MKKLWTDPNHIHIVEILNNREINTDYIGSLAESMERNGFLTEYPIEVFETAKIPSIQTSKPYICACGAHRTIAAMSAELDEVLCIIHDGGEEDWIETMSLDNFKFDVAADVSIGQSFTQKEKRAACTQLLLLPKYLEMTNTALAEAWKTSEGSIRGWRGQVASLIYEGSEKLQEYGISPARVGRLKAVLGKSARVNGDGEPVKVRQKARQATAEEKSSLYRTIRSDAGDFTWGAKLKKTFLGRHDIEWAEVQTFIFEKWNVEDTFTLYEQLSIQQLRTLHNLILTEDAGLIARCQALAKERKALEANKADISAACDLSEAMLHESFCPNQGTHSPRFRAVKEIFIRAARVEGYTDFSFDSYKYGRENGILFLRLAVTHHNEVSRAIEQKADWVEAVRVTIAEEEAATRAKIEKDFRKAKKKMLATFEAYPRNISLEAFCYGFDDHFREKAGHCLRRTQQDIPTKNASNTALECDTENFRRAAQDLKGNANWVKKIPEVPVAEAKTVTDVLEGGKVLFIKIHTLIEDKGVSYLFEDTTFIQDAIPLSEIPDTLMAQLLEIARKGKQEATDQGNSSPDEAFRSAIPRIRT